MLDAVKMRLESFGYMPVPEDDWMLQFILKKVEQDIRNSTNQTEVPEGLRCAAIDMTVGEFLFGKKASGQLDIETINLDMMAKSISEGDTSVSFGDGSQTPEQRLDALIASLRTSKGRNFAKYRRIVW